MGSRHPRHRQHGRLRFCRAVSAARVKMGRDGRATAGEKKKKKKTPLGHWGGHAGNIPKIPPKGKPQWHFTTFFSVEGPPTSSGLGGERRGTRANPAECMRPASYKRSFSSGPPTQGSTKKQASRSEQSRREGGHLLCARGLYGGGGASLPPHQSPIDAFSAGLVMPAFRPQDAIEPINDLSARKGANCGGCQGCWPIGGGIILYSAQSRPPKSRVLPRCKERAATAVIR